MEKIAKNGPKTGNLKTVQSSLIQKNIDFQRSLKIDLEITQCQQALVPVLLLFDESPKLATTSSIRVISKFHEI